MILVVAANPAIDLTYGVDAVALGTAGKVQVVGDKVGGKPLNVARTLAALDVAVDIVGLATDDFVQRFAEETCLTGLWVRVDGRARRTVTVVEQDADRVTLLSEPGTPVAAAAWDDLVTAVTTRLASGMVEALVVSGSLPPGVPADGPADLVRAAHRAGTPAVVDCAAAGFALAAGPDVIKPNAQELRDGGWGAVTGVDDALAAAQRLRDDGAQAAVVSLGADGLVAATADGSFVARPPVVQGGNPTGAGDAVVASLAATAIAGGAVPWDERLRRAAALGAAAAAEPTAGSVRLSRYEELLAGTKAEAAR